MNLSVGVYFIGLLASLTGMASASFGSGQYGWLIYFAALCLGIGLYMDRNKGGEPEETVPNN